MSLFKRKEAKEAPKLTTMTRPVIPVGVRWLHDQLYDDMRGFQWIGDDIIAVTLTDHDRMRFPDFKDVDRILLHYRGARRP